MTSGASEDRYTYPAEGEDPRDIDAEHTDAETQRLLREKRAVSHPQDRERSQGTSADSPGVDPSDRERV